jgi:hypothetical protein
MRANVRWSGRRGCGRGFLGLLRRQPHVLRMVIEIGVGRGVIRLGCKMFLVKKTRRCIGVAGGFLDLVSSGGAAGTLVDESRTSSANADKYAGAVGDIGQRGSKAESRTLPASSRGTLGPRTGT